MRGVFKMARAVKTGAREGSQSAHVKDATKIPCDTCGGTEWMVSSTLDDPNDITEDATFAALLLTYASGTSAQGLVGNCVQCGHEQVLWWLIFDVATTADPAQTSTMTNIDQATTANLMAGLYGMILAGTDIEKYVVVATNTAAAPTVITWAVTKPNVDTDGYIVITNRLPVGFTATS